MRGFWKWTVFLPCLFAACSDPVEAPEVVSTETVDTVMPLQYDREYLFVGRDDDAVVLAPFTFRTIDRGEELERSALGWFARGPTWDRFLEASRVTSAVGGVWRVVPFDGLRVIAGGPAEIEAFRYTRAERRLRLELRDIDVDWIQGGDSRFRLLSGQLLVGTQPVPGPVLEILSVERMMPDGWPAPVELDFAFLSAGDTLRILVSNERENADDTFVWIRSATDERVWSGGQLQWTESVPLEEARRDVPGAWTFDHAAAGLFGELEAIGYDAVLGPERAGRRAVEIRYSVEGWIELNGERSDVIGILRHVQR